MKWAKSFGLLLFSFCLFFVLTPLKYVDAATTKQFGAACIIASKRSNDRIQYMVFCPNNTSDTTIYVGNNSSATINYHPSSDSTGYGSISGWLNTYNDALEYYNNNESLSGSWAGWNLENIQYIVSVKGNISNSTGSDIVFDSYEDYEDSLTPSWWERVKDAFMDFVGSEAISDVLSGNWLAYIEDVLFGELWTVKVGEGEDDLIVPETVSATPTPSPTPIPTPIPYSTVINPSTGEVTYHYTIEVSGTPVPTSSIYPPVTSSPPGPGSGSTIDEPVAVEDYYEPEDSLSVPKLRIFKFLLRMTGNDVDVGMDSLDDNMAVMDATLEDNAEAISGVGDLFQLIPVKWFLLIGTLACFPVIAAMIKSLLGG